MSWLDWFAAIEPQFEDNNGDEPGVCGGGADWLYDTSVEGWIAETYEDTILDDDTFGELYVND